MVEIGGRHRERGKPRDAERNETRHLAVEVQERKDKRGSETQSKDRRLPISLARLLTLLGSRAGITLWSAADLTAERRFRPEFAKSVVVECFLNERTC